MIAILELAWSVCDSALFKYLSSQEYLNSLLLLALISNDDSLQSS